MKTIRLRLSRSLLQDAERGAAALGLSRAAYLRTAIEHMNREVRIQRMAEVSQRVRGESMRVNAEFAAFECAPG